MSKNTLFNYFTRSPASTVSKTNGSPNVESKTPKRPSKDDSITPKTKKTPAKSVNGSSRKDKIANGSTSKKATEKRKPKELGNNLIYYRLIKEQ